MSTSVPFRAALSSVAPVDAPGHSAEDRFARVQSIRSSLGSLARQIVPARDVPERSAPATIATGVRSLDALIGGVPRGALTEVCGPASSGRTTVLLSLMAAMTRAGEVCALVDATDSFSPHAAADAGVDLRQLLWVRCNGKQPQKEKQQARFIANDFAGHDYVGHGSVDAKTVDPKGLASSANPFAARATSTVAARDRIERSQAFRRVEQALKITDLLLQGGGFGLIVIDLGDVTPEVARRVPMTSWFRFRRTVENTPTALVVLEQEPSAKTCASLVMRAQRTEAQRTSPHCEAPTHARLLRGMEIAIEIERANSLLNDASITRGAKKPPRSARVDFNAEAKWG